jgi:hypothetical protein
MEQIYDVDNKRVEQKYDLSDGGVEKIYNAGKGLSQKMDLIPLTDITENIEGILLGEMDDLPSFKVCVCKCRCGCKVEENNSDIDLSSLKIPLKTEPRYLN